MNSPQRKRDIDIAPISFPVLIADIGGTNVRFAVLSEAHSPVREFPTVHTGDFPDFQSAAEETVLHKTAIMPKSLLIALAGPLMTGPTKLTNANWVVDPDGLRESLSLETVITFNDFEALALSLPALRDDQMMTIGEAEAHAREPRVVVGPGTGLGVAILVYANRHYRPIAGEGGHVDFGPQTERDFAIWPHLDRFHGRISAEALLSGNGLARIYRALCRAEGAAREDCERGPEVSERALAGDPLADEAIELFLTYLGRFAGDLALLTLAKGGVYIAGGIAPRLAERFAASGFRPAFEAKAPHEAILKAIPTFLVTEPKPAVAGMATFATLPERFELDLSNRRFGL